MVSAPATEVVSGPASRPPGPQGNGRRWSGDVLGVGWVVVAAVAVLVPALSHGSALGPYDWLDRYGLSQQHAVVKDIHGDQILQMIPWTQLAWTQVHQGHLPLWNSYSALGMPLAFNWQSATFSLPALIGYAVPLHLAFTVQVLTTLIVAGTGAYVLGRVMHMGVLACAFAGTAFELSGAFMFWLGWPIGSVLSWSGWLFAAVLLIMRGGHRVRHVGLFALALAFAVYAGQPDALTLLVLSVAVFAVTLLVLRVGQWRGGGEILRPGIDLVLGVAAGVGLTAPLALPGYQIAGAAIRTFEGSTFGRQTAFPFQQLGALAFAGLNGVSIQLSPIYLSIIVVVLAVAGVWVRRTRPEVIALTVVAVIMGAIAFVQPVENALHLAPGLQAVRWYRSAVLASLALAVLGGAGMDLLVRSWWNRTVRRVVGVGFAAAAVILLTAWVIGPNPVAPRGVHRLLSKAVATAGATGLNAAGTHTRTTGYLWSACEVAVGLAGIGTLAAVVSRTRPGSGHGRTTARAVGTVFLVTVTAFLVFTGQSLWRSSATPGVATPAESSLQDAVGSSLVGLGFKRCFFPPGLGIRPDANILFGVHELAVYDPMLPRAYYQSWTDATGQSVQSAGYPFNSLYCPGITSAAIARIYGVAFVLEPHTARGPTGSVLDRMVGNEKLYRIPGSGSATLTPLAPGGALPPDGARGTVIAVTHPGPAAWTLVTSAPTPQVLRLRLTDVPGWHATIDGKPLTLQRYAGVMLQARIPAGRYTVQLHYWPSTFTDGIVLAGVTVVAFVAVTVVTRRRRPGTPAPTDG